MFGAAHHAVGRERRIAGPLDMIPTSDYPELMASWISVV